MWVILFQGVLLVNKSSLRMYWWHKMKQIVGNFVLRYLTCQQVKFEHAEPGMFWILDFGFFHIGCQ